MESKCKQHERSTSPAGAERSGGSSEPDDCDCDSCLLGFDDTQPDGIARRKMKKIVQKSSWKKIRSALYWSPFVQQFRKRKYQWIQLAGHEGNFLSGDEAGTILKKLCPKELNCLQRLMSDVLSPYLPQYKAEVEKDGEKYIQMQDLLYEFETPSVMDCKIGTRTYLEDELRKARGSPKARKDLYKKMVEISPDEPTAEERAQEGISKPRYMIWRETTSSSANLGFRIEGTKKQTGQNLKFKKTKTKEDVKKEFKDFANGSGEVMAKYVTRLKSLRSTLETSPFFATHEVVGSSLLFVHDGRGQAGVWMIDFGKTVQLPDERRLNHRLSWTEGNQEDGYLFGLDNMINAWEELLTDTGFSANDSTNGSLDNTKRLK